MSDRRKQMTFGRRELIEQCHAQAVKDGLDRSIVVVANDSDAPTPSLCLARRSSKASGHHPILIQARERPDNLDPRSNGYAVLEKTARENLFAVVVIGDGGSHGRRSLSWGERPSKMQIDTN